MKILNIGIVVLFVSLNSSLIKAQTFQAKIIAGLNASQLEGDQISGFNKIGIHGGIGIEYPLLKNSIHVELLYSQKGSKSKSTSNLSAPFQSTQLNYLQIPIIYSINNWYDEENLFYKINVHFGPTISRLFGISSHNNVLDNREDEFKKFDFGAVLGAGYRINNKWSLGIRYDQSIVKIYQPENNPNSALISYLVTLRAEYHL